MAKQVNYEHPNGVLFPQSYWRITHLDVDVPNRIAKFHFHGYKDAASRLEGKEPIGHRLIEITGTDFDTKFAEVTLKTKNPQEVGYEFSANFKDVRRLQTVTVTELDINGEEIEVERESEVLESFFKDAVDV